MKKLLLLPLLALPLLLSSCATPPPPRQAFHHTDDSALVIRSLDQRSSQLLLPTTSAPTNNAQVVSLVKSLPPRQTAVVILENYNESQVGRKFRSRSIDWFAELRGLGYEHIFFVQGSGVADANGLPLLARYD